MAGVLSERQETGVVDAVNTHYQNFKVLPESRLCEIVFMSHPEFYCLHQHQTEVAFNSILFNNIYSSTFLTVKEKN